MVGIYVGYDKPRNLGKGATGGHLAAPIAKDFMKLALADKPAIPFKVPAGIKLVRVDAKSGMRAGPGEVAAEPFWKPSSRAPRRRIITPSIGVADADGRPIRRGTPPDAGNIMRARDRRAVLGAFDSVKPLGMQPERIALCGARGYIRQQTIEVSGIHRRSERPCAPKSNASLKRSSSQSGC